MTILNSVNNQALETSSSPAFAQTTLSALNPSITYTGTFKTPLQFTMYKSALYQNATFTNNILSASIDMGSAFSDSTLLTLNLGGIQQITNAFNQTFTVMTSLVASSLISLPISLAITAPLLTTLTMGSLAYVNALTMSAATLTTFSLPGLLGVAGSFAPTLALATTVSAPALLNVLSGFAPVIASCTTLTMTNLLTVGASFNGGTYTALTTVSFPALTTIGVNIAQAWPAATTFSMPNLVTVGNNLSPNLAVCTTLTLTSLATIGANVAATLPSLVSWSLPAIVSIAGTFSITTPTALTTFSFGSTLKSIGGNVTITGAALNQASVDGILVSLAALDGTGGTTSYNSHTVNLSGGTSSAPSATGVAAAATLTGRGCTVTTN